jgi:hypothetical protein
MFAVNRGLDVTTLCCILEKQELSQARQSVRTPARPRVASASNLVSVEACTSLPPILPLCTLDITLVLLLGCQTAISSVFRLYRASTDSVRVRLALRAVNFINSLLLWCLGLFFTRAQKTDTPLIVCQLLHCLHVLPRHSVFVRIRVLNVPFVTAFHFDVHTYRSPVSSPKPTGGKHSLHRSTSPPVGVDDSNGEVPAHHMSIPFWFAPSSGLLNLESFGHGLYRATVSYGYAQTKFDAASIASQIKHALWVLERTTAHRGTIYCPETSVFR